MQSHIEATMIHFKDKYPGVVQQYTVVNKAFDWTRFKGFWYEKIGPDFINLAFQTAKTDPNVQLQFIMTPTDLTIKTGWMESCESCF